MHGRIWFPGNPWPDGHRVTEFAWNGRLDGSGKLWFDLHLETADYDEADEADDEADPADDIDEDDNDIADWLAPTVWQNYHACWLSSTSDDATGLLAGTPERPFRFADRAARPLVADPLPIEDLDAEPAFHIYLLGHDSVAEHEVTFTPERTGGHRIDWSGRIALTYAGDEEFRYGFRAELRNVRLGYVALPTDMPLDEAYRRLTPLVDVPERFVPAEVDGRRVLTLVEP
jgi:hypothetical protein